MATQGQLDKLSNPPPIAVDTTLGDSTISPPDSLSPPSQTKTRSDSVSLLQSSRPAPPSPASSRPGSQLFFHSPNLAPSSPRDRSGSNSSSRIGSGIPRRVSGASSRQSDREKTSRRKSTLGHFSLPVDESEGGGSSQATSTGQNTPNDNSLVSTPIPEDAATASGSKELGSSRDAVKKPSIPILTVVIRDYAFPSTDERFFGRGQLASPQKQKWRFSNFTLGRRPSGSASGEGSPRSPDPNSGENDDRKGWGFGFLGWRGFGSRKASMSSETNSQSNTPIHDEPEDADDVDDDDYFSDEHDETEEPWGMYRAAYSFDAEGEHEMSLTEGEVIEVRGRGGGEGWVIGIKKGQEGLVPEGYLERHVSRGADEEDSVEELRDEKPN